MTKRDEWLRFACLTVLGLVIGITSLLEPMHELVDGVLRLFAAILLVLAAQNFPEPNNGHETERNRL